MLAAVLRHAEIEGAGLLENIMAEKGIEYRIADVTNDGIPEADIYISMGGPQSANDRKEWVAREQELLMKHISKGGYALGVCLGAQMIAKATGGGVRKARKKEAGNYEVELTPEGLEDRMLNGLGQRFPVFQWHGETVSKLPEEGTLLASGNGMTQAFRIGNAYGLQLHLEATKGMIGEWIGADRNYASLAGKTTEQVMDEFMSNAGLYGARLRIFAEIFFEAANERR